MEVSGSQAVLPWGAPSKITICSGSDSLIQLLTLIFSLGALSGAPNHQVQVSMCPVIGSPSLSHCSCVSVWHLLQDLHPEARGLPDISSFLPTSSPKFQTCLLTSGVSYVHLLLPISPAWSQLSSCASQVTAVAPQFISVCLPVPPPIPSLKDASPVSALFHTMFN